MGEHRDRRQNEHVVLLQHCLVLGLQSPPQPLGDGGNGASGATARCRRGDQRGHRVEWECTGVVTDRAGECLGKSRIVRAGMIRALQGLFEERDQAAFRGDRSVDVGSVAMQWHRHLSDRRIREESAELSSTAPHRGADANISMGVFETFREDSDAGVRIRGGAERPDADLA